MLDAPCDFDACRREHFLDRFKHRDAGGRRICDANLVTLVLSYFPGLRKVRLTNRLLSLSYLGPFRVPGLKPLTQIGQIRF